MFEFELEDLEKEFGALYGLEKKFEVLKLVRPVLRSCNGVELEDVLWTFTDSVDALKAALKMKKAMASFNHGKSGEN